MGALHVPWCEKALYKYSSFPFPFPKKGAEPLFPIFVPFLLWPHGWRHQGATCFGGRPQPRGIFVRLGHSSPPRNRGRSRQFSAHVYCGQTAVCMMMPFGTEVGVGLDDIVLYGLCVRWAPSSLPKKGAGPLPNFRPMSVVAKRLDRSRCHLVER